MSDLERHNRDREAAAKLALKRVQNTEKHFGDICAVLGSITRKNARLRDKGDLLARHLMSLAESEKQTPSLHNNMLKFAENYAAVQDYCHAKVQRLESKVLKPLTKYGEKCRFVKRGIKSEISACGKEKKLVQKLEKFQAKGDEAQMVSAEMELQKVQGEEALVGEAMEVEVEKFEREKLFDVKNMLTELVKIEMLYHAKSLEFLSLCYENTQSIDMEAAFEEIRRAMVKPAKMSSTQHQGQNKNNNNNNRGRARSVERLGIDAATLTSTGSSSRSSDTRASSTLGSSSYTSTLNSTGRSTQRSLQRSQSAAAPRTGSNQYPQPSPRYSGRHPSPSPRGGVGQSSPSPRGVRQSSLSPRRPSPRVRISSQMYPDDDDDDDSDEDYDD